MKKALGIILTLCLTVCIAVAGFGCGKKSLNENNTPINVNLPKDHKGSVTIATMTNFYNDIVKVAKAFNEEYPNIKVNIRPQSDQSKTILQWYNGDKVKPGSCPDIFWFTTLTYQPLMEGGILKDLTPAMEAAEKAGTLDADDLKKEIMILGKENFSESGKQYLLPTTYDQFVTYINCEIFTRAGIEISNRGTDDITFTYTPIGGSKKTVRGMDWTWTDFEEIALMISKFYTDNNLFNGAKPVTTHLESEALITAVLKSHGVDIFDENNNLLIKSGEDRTALVEALTFMNSMVQNGYTSYIPSGAMAQGNIAMHFQSRAGMIVPENPTAGVEFPDSGYFHDELLDVVPFPAIGNTPKVGGGSHGYAMYRYTQHQDEAWALLQFMLSQKGQDVLGDTGLQVPVLKSMDTAKTEGENWKWLSKPVATMNHQAFISYPERLSPTIFHMSLPTKIQDTVFKAYVAMAQNTTQNGGYEAEIDKFIRLIEAELKKV